MLGEAVSYIPLGEPNMFPTTLRHLDVRVRQNTPLHGGS